MSSNGLNGGNDSSTESRASSSGASSSNNSSDQKDLTRGIRAEVARLAERWNALLHHADSWSRKLDDMLPVSKYSCVTCVSVC